LGTLQDIENNHGRERIGDRWGPRTLDLDILLYNDLILNTQNLTLPHYGMQEREFVLVPLFEIAPDKIMQDGRSLASWVAKCNLDGLYRIEMS
jgi:2-amino-4-hydroxy-6-hydroxymethyldihydropteridine diphosphokinase